MTTIRRAALREAVQRGPLMVQASRVLFACMATLTVTPAIANLIVNGSFEDPIVPPASYTNYPGGSNDIIGWTVVGIDSAVVDGMFAQSGIIFQAQDGNQWIDLAGVSSNSMTSGVTQSIPTILNQAYELRFYVGSATDNQIFFPTTIDLSINGGTRVSYTNSVAPSNMLNWQLFTVPFTATSSTTNLTFYNGGASDNYNSSLDNISVNAVPEPATLLLLVAAIVMKFARRTAAVSFRA